MQGIRALDSSSVRADVVPFRKQLRDEAKQKRLAGHGKLEKKRAMAKDPRLEKWELTVGIEVHAQLNTERKLFSSEIALLHSTVSPKGLPFEGAATSVNDQPNSHVSLFDLAFPGSQPVSPYFLGNRNLWASQLSDSGDMTGVPEGDSSTSNSRRTCAELLH